MKTFQTKAHHLEVNHNYASWQNYIKMSSVMKTKQSRSNAFILRNVLCARLARIILQNLPHKNCARHFSYFFAYLLNEKKICNWSNYVVILKAVLPELLISILIDCWSLSFFSILIVLILEETFDFSLTTDQLIR